MEVICQNLNELAQIANSISKHLQPNTLILLDGDLGSGKTAFVKLLAKSIGIQEMVSSPTFTLVNEYYSGTLPLYHIDLYRLEKQKHIEELHLELYWQGQEFLAGITAIEWAKKLPRSIILPDYYYHIQFQIVDDTSRQISFLKIPSETFLH